MMSSQWESGLGRCVVRALIVVVSLCGSACSTTNDPAELSVVVSGDPAIMSQLSRVLVQTFSRDGSQLLEYHTFALADGAAAPLARGLPLTHAFQAPRDKDSTIRVLALGFGVVDGAERPLVETQKLASFAHGRTGELTLYFARACYQKFCRTELRGSSETCVEGSCVSIPSSNDPTPSMRDASAPVAARPPLDAGPARAARVEDAAVVLDEIDSRVPSNIGDDAGCDGAVDLSCPCANGAPPPCEPAPPDAGPACDVGKHVGTFDGAVGQNINMPNTPVAGTFSFEVPAPGRDAVVTIVQGSLSGATANGSTLVASFEGRWNCAQRSLEEGRVSAGVYTYAERILNTKIEFSGTLTGAYAAGAQSATGQWKIATESNTGGFGTWSARR